MFLFIRINDAQLDNAGIYSIVATNELGEAALSTLVTVEKKREKPLIIRELQNVQAVEGLGAKLDVKVLGHPKPELQWLKDDKPIDSKSSPFKLVDLEDGTSTLSLDNVSPNGKFNDCFFCSCKVYFSKILKDTIETSFEINSTNEFIYFTDSGKYQVSPL